jgi:antitoxin component YwqK of YwqJK toxin-antitoxin module
VDGLLDGNYKKYYDGTDKVQQEMNYKNNKLDGDVIYYNEQGIATMKYIYKNGEKVSGGLVEEKK